MWTYKISQCTSVTRSNCSRFFFCTSIKKNFLYSSFTFSLDQFYRFTCIIHLYIILLQCFIRHTCYSLRFSLVILQKKFFCTVFLLQFYCIANLVVKTIFIVSLVQFIYIGLPNLLSVTRAIFKSLLLVIFSN